MLFFLLLVGATGTAFAVCCCFELCSKCLVKPLAKPFKAVFHLRLNPMDLCEFILFGDFSVIF